MIIDLCWALLAHVGGSRWVARGFGYLHVGIGNAKLSHWGFRPTQDPNAKGYALQWNISLMVKLSDAEL